MRASVLLLILGLMLPAAARADEAIAYYPTHPVTREELAGKTLRELDLMRNSIFARAGNVFRKRWLRDYFTAQPWYKPTGLDESKLSELDKANAQVIGEYAASIPREELRKRREALAAKAADLTPEDVVELQLLGRALGGGERVTVKGREVEADSSPLDNPALLEKPITTEQLADLSPRDLRILRNTIYARRGRPFKDKELREYFSRMEWYSPDPKYTEAKLTKLDRRNLKVVQSVEAELKAPEPTRFFGGA